MSSAGAALGGSRSRTRTTAPPPSRGPARLGRTRVPTAPRCPAGSRTGRQAEATGGGGVWWGKNGRGGGGGVGGVGGGGWGGWSGGAGGGREDRIKVYPTY